MGTAHGEELPYVFGAPLIDGFNHFPRNYTKSEVTLSEAVIVYISNFVRTGNPNDHQRTDGSWNTRERSRYRNIVWDEYDSVHQKYLEMGEFDFTSYSWIMYNFYQCGNCGKQNLKPKYSCQNQKKGKQKSVSGRYFKPTRNIYSS
ncbi:hypothetical protein RUM44_003889 [Polyplax serrata]|uniref:Carboxylesterase type B domain-containing protein n=1 Tax=Polyplax serrata TaxID=468196 RepID=A0ABR1B2V4_POLSC